MPKRAIGSADHHAMPFAADAVENDAGDPYRRIVRGKAAHQRCRRLGLTRDIDHQHDWQAEMRGKIGGGAAPAARARRAIEQTHDAFDHAKDRRRRPLARPARREAFPTSPRN